MKTLSSFGMGIVALALLSVAPSKALAQLTWDIAPGTVGVGNGTVTGGAGNWNTTAGNGVWTSDVGANNVIWTNGNSATFGDVGGAVNVNGAVSATTVTVNTTGYTFSGASALTVTSGMTANESTNFANPLTFSGAQSWSVASGKTLTISGAATANNSIAVSGGGTVELSGSTGKLAGNTGISIGANTTFALASGYNGIAIMPTNFTILAGGSLAANATGSNAHNIGALDLQGGSVTSANATHGGFGNFILNGVGANVTHTGDTQSVMSASLIDLGTGGARTFTVNDGASAVDLLVSSSLFGTPTFTKAGTGTMQLTGSNSFTGNINVNGGTLTTSTTGGVPNLGSRTATRTITVNSGAILELLGTYRLATGGNVVPGSSVTIDGGTLQNNNTVSAQFDVISNLTLRNGATLTANSSNFSAAYQAFQLRGNVTVANTGGNTIASTIVGGTGTNRGLHLYTNTNFDVANVTGTAAADLTVSTELVNQNGDLASAAGALTKSGLGRMDLTAFNTFTGGTTVSQGTLALNTNGSSGTGTVLGTLNVDSGATLLSLNRETLGWNGVNRVSTVNLTGGTLTHDSSQVLTFWGATINMTGAMLQTITNGGTLQIGTDAAASNIPSAINVLASPTTSTITRTGTNQTLSLLQSNLTFDVADGAAATDLQVSLPISGASRGITKANSGTMVLSAANTYTGGTTVNGGKLVGAVTGSLSTAGTILVNTGGTLSWTANGYNTFPSLPLNIVGGTVSLDSGANNAHNFISQTLTMQGGTLTSINGVGGAANDGGFGNFILNSSNLVVSGTAQSTISTTTLATTGTANFNVGDAVAGVDLLVSSKIILGSPIVKNGLGTMKLTGANEYTALTTINAGTLLVSNTTGSGVGTNNVSINGGTLGGTGFVGTAGDASNVAFAATGGTIAPGESAGQLTVFGDVNFTSAGTKTFAVEINGLTVGTLYDQLVINSATGGTNLINLANAALSVSLGFTPNVNDQFTILLNNTPSAITGNFFGLVNNSTFLVNTTTFRINYDAGTGNNDVVLTVVPEPGAFALLLFGALSMFLFRGNRTR